MLTNPKCVRTGRPIHDRGGRYHRAPLRSDIADGVSREARAITGCFRATNLGALAMEFGLRPAAAQLENGQRLFGLRLLSMPQGDQAGRRFGHRLGLDEESTNRLNADGAGPRMWED